MRKGIWHWRSRSACMILTTFLSQWQEEKMARDDGDASSAGKFLWFLIGLSWFLSHNSHRQKGATKNIVSKVTTLRQHIEAMHEVLFHGFDVDYTNNLSSMHIINGRWKRTSNPSCQKPFVWRRTPRLLKTMQSSSLSNCISPMSHQRKRLYLTQMPSSGMLLFSGWLRPIRYVLSQVYISCSDIGLRSQFRLLNTHPSKIWLTLLHDLPAVFSFQTVRVPAPILSSCLNKIFPIYEIGL